MSRIDEYRESLESTADREAYILAHSGPPGPRGNLELARAAADVCSTTELHRWARLGPDEAPTGTAEEFLAFAGVLGLGGPLVKGDVRALEELRRHASDPRWRIREAVAMALQRWGEADFEALATAMHEWAHGTSLERRAAAAALCEPALLTTPERVGKALAVLAEASAGISEASAEERRSDEFKALRKGLGYCWSVAVVAAPEVGRPAFEELVSLAWASNDRDLAWVARENLRKRRLERLDPGGFRGCSSASDPVTDRTSPCRPGFLMPAGWRSVLTARRAFRRRFRDTPCGTRRRDPRVRVSAGMTPTARKRMGVAPAGPAGHSWGLTR